MNSYLATLAICTVSVALAACGTDDGQPPSSTMSVASPTVAPPITQSATAALPASGGNVAITNATFSVGPNVVAAYTPATLSESDDQTRLDDFIDVAISTGIHLYSAREYVVSLATPNVDCAQTCNVSIVTEAPIVQDIRAGNSVQLYATIPYDSNDDDMAETINSFYQVDGAFDQSTGIFSAVLPTEAFITDGAGGLTARLRIITFDPALAGLQTEVVRATAAPTAIDTAAAATFSNPLGTKQLVIAGPFGEGGGLHAGSGHGGIDLITPVNSPIFAVADGYIKSVVLEGCNAMNNAICSATHDILINQVSTTVSKMVSLTLQHQGFQTAYRHIALNSVVAGGALLAANEQRFFNETPCTKNTTTNCSTVRKYPVKAGTQVALSGDTGTQTVKLQNTSPRPHLHFEYLTGGCGVTGLFVCNPLFKLARIDFSPYEMFFYGSTPTQTTNLIGRDTTSSQEVLVRRNKAPMVLTSIAAQGSAFGQNSVTPTVDSVIGSISPGLDFSTTIALQVMPATEVTQNGITFDQGQEVTSLQVLPVGGAGGLVPVRMTLRAYGSPKQLVYVDVPADFGVARDNAFVNTLKSPSGAGTKVTLAFRNLSASTVSVCSQFAYSAPVVSSGNVCSTVLVTSASGDDQLADYKTYPSGFAGGEELTVTLPDGVPSTHFLSIP